MEKNKVPKTIPKTSLILNFSQRLDQYFFKIKPCIV